MEIYFVLIFALAGYLFGSISFARLVTKIWLPGKDAADFEVAVDGTDERYKVVSVGGNAVSTMLGPKAGMTVGVLDILKVYLPTLLAKQFFPEHATYALVVAAAGLAGHVWPVYYKFHGGAGFSAIMGGLLAIDWLAILIVPVAGLFLGMVVLRNMIAANLSWLWLLIPWFWWRTGGDAAHILFAIALNIIFIAAMIPEYKTAQKYKQQGMYLEYGLGQLKSNPMGRNMLKIANFFHVEIK